MKINLGRFGIGKGQRTIKEGTDEFSSRCAVCNHSKLSHGKAQYRDEGRMNLFTAKKIESECNICKQEGKKCEFFKPK